LAATAISFGLSIRLNPASGLAFPEKITYRQVSVSQIPLYFERGGLILHTILFFEFPDNIIKPLIALVISVRYGSKPGQLHWMKTFVN
jgi:hypothetical protein